MGFSMVEMNQFTVSYFYELLDIYIGLNSDSSENDDSTIEADQDYYDRLFNR